MKYIDYFLVFFNKEYKVTKIKYLSFRYSYALAAFRDFIKNIPGRFMKEKYKNRIILNKLFLKK